MNLFFIRKYIILRILFLFTNIFQSIYEYLILILNIYKEYEYISLWLCCPVNFSNEKYVSQEISQEKEIFRIFFEKK